MKKISTVRVNGNMIFKGHKLTIGVDLGDRWSCYCVLDEAGEILLEQKVATTPEAMKQIFEKIPRGLIAMETGTHSPWVSRLLREQGHQALAECSDPPQPARPDAVGTFYPSLEPVDSSTPRSAPLS
jgi:hypothetical protein